MYPCEECSQSCLHHPHTRLRVGSQHAQIFPSPSSNFRTGSAPWYGGSNSLPEGLEGLPHESSNPRMARRASEAVVQAAECPRYVATFLLHLLAGEESPVRTYPTQLQQTPSKSLHRRLPVRESRPRRNTTQSSGLNPFQWTSSTYHLGPNSTCYPHIAKDVYPQHRFRVCQFLNGNLEGCASSRSDRHEASTTESLQKVV